MNGGAGDQWELVEPADQPGVTSDAEELDVGRRRHGAATAGRWDRIVTVVAVIVAVTAVIVLLVREPGTSRQAAPETPSVDLNRAVGPPTALDVVRGLVRRPGSLQDILRQDAGGPQCQNVRVGSNPVQAVIASLRTTLGPVVLIDSQRTIDQFAGLCSLQLRARFGSATVGVSITAPPPGVTRASYDNLETGVETQEGVTTQYAQDRDEVGWQILVGAVGRQVDLPGSQALLDATQAPGMRWS